MSSADAARSDQARDAARARWEQAGNPVVARAAETIISRAGELDDGTRAEVLAAISQEVSGGGQPEQR